LIPKPRFLHRGGALSPTDVGFWQGNTDYVACLGAFLTFAGLCALRYVDLQILQRKEKVHMKKTSKVRSNRCLLIKKSVISTVGAIGTGMWSALALSG
jgi:hypothetical protein